VNLYDLASTIAYILSDDGPFSRLDPTNLVIEFIPGWGWHPCDEEYYYLGPADISVEIGSDEDYGTLMGHNMLSKWKDME
jgi:hypothetical protein